MAGEKIYLKDLQRAAYTYSVVHGRDVFVWVTWRGEKPKTRWPTYCMEYAFTFAFIRPDLQPGVRSMPFTVSSWHFWKRVAFEKANKWMKKHERKEVA